MLAAVGTNKQEGYSRLHCADFITPEHQATTPRVAPRLPGLGCPAPGSSCHTAALEEPSFFFFGPVFDHLPPTVALTGSAPVSQLLLTEPGLRDVIPGHGLRVRPGPRVHVQRPVRHQRRHRREKTRNRRKVTKLDVGEELNRHSERQTDGHVT